MIGVLRKIFIVLHQKQADCCCFVSGVMLVFVNNPTQLRSEEYEKGVDGGPDVAGSQQINKEAT